MPPSFMSIPCVWINPMNMKLQKAVQPCLIKAVYRRNYLRETREFLLLP